MLMLSAAHPPADVRIVLKEGAALAEAGLAVEHLSPEAPGMPAQAAGVRLLGFPRPRGRWGRIRHIWRLSRLARARGARVIHAHEPDSWLAGWLARPARLVIDVHEHYPSRLDDRLPRWARPLGRASLRLFCRLMGRLADAVVVAKDGLAEDYGRDCVAVRNYAGDPGTAPRRHAPGPVTLLHLGAISRARGWPQLLAALSLGPADARLAVAGRFTDGTQAEFEAEAARRGLSGRITLHGWLPQAEMAALAGRCDINLVLFQPGHENHRLALPHKLSDGMLAGLPVIAPDFATEVATMVRQAECGLLVDVADPFAIADAVRRLTVPSLRARLGSQGRAAALGRFGWRAQAEALRNLYAGLSAGRDLPQHAALLGKPPPRGL
ncbi:glycosyltransferase [Rhodovarius crocodyli]|uniref:glycosyltransferase n=1 Tax=Rhodovarius crocodyli TaxID=1979269 RepID=UPI001F0BC92A|nr:glycosyltransferase [Rhodovarius crocodyli]